PPTGLPAYRHTDTPLHRYTGVPVMRPASHDPPTYQRSSHTPDPCGEVASTCHTSGESNASPVDCQCTNTRSTVWLAPVPSTHRAGNPSPSTVISTGWWCSALPASGSPGE